MTRSSSTARLRVTACLLLAVIAAVAVSRRDMLAGATGELAVLAGLMLMIGAALGRIWTSVFIAGFKDETLVTIGPYAACRHPLYAASMLGMLGAGLATRSLSLTVLVCATFLPLYLHAARAEDARLARLHGPEFEQYRARTPAFLPQRAVQPVPAELLIRPWVFRKSFLDAGALIGVYVAIRLADLAQAGGMTPVLLDLP